MGKKEAQAWGRSSGKHGCLQAATHNTRCLIRGVYRQQRQSGKGGGLSKASDKVRCERVLSDSQEQCCLDMEFVLVEMHWGSSHLKMFQLYCCIFTCQHLNVGLNTNSPQIKMVKPLWTLKVSQEVNLLPYVDKLLCLQVCVSLWDGKQMSKRKERDQVLNGREISGSCKDVKKSSVYLCGHDLKRSACWCSI